MRLTSIGSAALLSAAVLSLAAPAAAAGDDGGAPPSGFTVSPGSVAPGGTVTLGATGCRAPGVTVSSGVFGPVTLHHGHPATVVVDPGAQAGKRYDVTFACAGRRSSAPLLVSGTPDKRIRAVLSGSLTDLDTTELVAGGVLIAAALGGVLHLRRRTAHGAS
ncbi:hypothetical protein OG372_29905 [Streptomyces sp. NBC_01020]|uniref:hypothetical protein n=1 Tax=unclassified Streptomyces TaxID=2593676 RepID=UPI003251D21D|nr:hypothetical protein OG372_29905 [Streptomyces sp. NBC_01020]WSX66393.1 hypothetical protein OG221_07075 [Streptomyces sp. NBC_00932]